MQKENIIDSLTEQIFHWKLVCEEQEMKVIRLEEEIRKMKELDRSTKK